MEIWNKVINMMLLLFLAPLSGNIEGRAILMGVGFVVGNNPDVQCGADTFPGKSFIWGTN